MKRTKAGVGDDFGGINQGGIWTINKKANLSTAWFGCGTFDGFWKPCRKHHCQSTKSCQPGSHKSKHNILELNRTCAASSAFAPPSPFVIGTEFCDDSLVLGAGCGGTCACCSFFMKLSLLVSVGGTLFGDVRSGADDDVFCVIIVAVDVNAWLSTSTSLLCGSFELLLLVAPTLPASRTPSIDLR